MLGLTSDPLAIYLNDHLAAATFGTELARRARAQNEGTGYGRFLAELAREIEEDREQLEVIMEGLGIGADRVKTSVAWAGEKVGRLKPNGRLRGYAPLSRLIELEGLRAGVEGKRAMWEALREIAPSHPALELRDLTRLAERAEAQLEGLRREHARAVRETFESG